MNAGDETLSDIFRRHSQEELLPYESFARRVRTVLNAESCGVFLVRSEDDKRVLELISEDCDSGHGDPEPAPKLPIRSKKHAGLTSHLAHCGRIVRLTGKALRNSPYFAGNRPLHLKDGVDHSLLSFPLKNRKGQLLGLVKVQNKKGKNGRPGSRIQFTDADVSLAAFLSSRLVVALQAREFVSFLKTLLPGKASPGDLYSFESKTLSEALNLIGADRGTVALWDDHKRTLIVAVQVGDGFRRQNQRVPRRSVMQTVWKKRESISIPDVAKYKGPYFEASPKTRSEIAVLIAARDSSGQLQPLGVLNAESSSARNFDKQDQEMLEGVADSLAVVVNSARPEMSLRDALASLSAPARVFAEPQKLLSSILERVRDTYDLDRGVVYVAEETGGLLRLGAQIGCEGQQHLVGSYTHEMSKDSLAASVWRTGEPVYSERPRQDPRVLKEGLDIFGIQGPLLGLPLIHSGKTLGVLICWSFEGPPPRPEHQRRLAPFAQVAAAEIAISHAYGLLDEWIHSIAQPSQNVGGLVHMIGRTDDSATRRDFMGTLKSEAEHLVSIVQRSRLIRQHQRVAPVRKNYCLLRVVQATAAAFQQQAEESGIKLELNLPQVPECPICGDENRLGIALGEVVNNALKHSQSGGMVKMSLTKAFNQYRVYIIDEGDGVPEAYAKDIFYPYFSLLPGGGRAGTGLGLAIASGILREEGGMLTYSPNEAGRGSVFTLSLPMENK